MTFGSLLCYTSAAAPSCSTRRRASPPILACCCNARHLQRSQLLSTQLTRSSQPVKAYSQRGCKTGIAYTRCSAKSPGQYVVDGRSGDACAVCSGTTQVQCSACKGSGKLTKAGYHSRNPVNTAKIVGSKWTALHRTLGWRHFRATQKMKAGKQVYALMMATCDSSTCLWINTKNLKDRHRWASGWLQKSEMEAMTDLGATCQVCAGTGHMICPQCKNAPVVIM